MAVRWLDLLVVAAYFVAIVAIGLRFARHQNSTETYFVAGRSIPAWAIGLSLQATIISAVTFIAYPGSGYAGNWSMLVPGIMVIVVPLIVGPTVIPFYRRVVGMSAYEYFGRRFGYPARAYSSLAFALGAFAKMAFVIYLLALTVTSMTGWRVEFVAIGIGAITVFYTLVGGLEAVIWADVVQGFVLWAGVLTCLGYLLFLAPAGPSPGLRLSLASNKFSLGSTAFVFSKPTIVVLAVYGFFWYLQKYTADQTMVQRYLASKSDKDALKAIFLGAAMCIPAWMLFMFIGTELWSFYKTTGELLPAYITKSDQVFPYFIRTHVPAGIAGLIVAALFGAAMATLSSDLNCLATVAVEDFYRHFWPAAADRKRLRVAKWCVLFCGIVGVAAAIRLAHSHQTALSLWYAVSAIVTGGLAGLFLLAFLSDRANRHGAYAGIIASLAFTAWATLSLAGGGILNMGRFNFPLHEYTIGAIGHVILLLVGYLASFLFHDNDESKKELTLWGWRRRQQSGPQSQLAAAIAR
jgi:solute:Na+ symporter, SSS family